MGRRKALTRLKLRVVVAVAACSLSMASFATVHAPCNSNQKANQKSNPACVQASAGKAKPQAKATSRAAVNVKGGTKAKAVTKGRGRATTTAASKTLAIATVPAATEPPQTPATVDCDSTQTLLQGGAAQCTAEAHNLSALATQPQANPGNACFAALAASHSARRLAAKVPFLSDSAPSPEALANSSLPTRMEKEELGSVMAGYSMCLDMAASWRSQAYAPAVLSALNGFWRTAQSILSELAGGKRSYGDAARAIADSDKAYKSQIGQL
jgi:hypothetical protein